MPRRSKHNPFRPRSGTLYRCVLIVLIASSARPVRGFAHDAEANEVGCTCAHKRTSGGWCKECSLGYVAGATLRSKMLIDAIDVYGHVIDPAQLTCPICRNAIRHDGYCDSCRMGFVGGKLYLSHLTYLLARGEHLDAAGITCETCRSHLAQSRWCGTCRRGLVGNVAYADVAMYEQAALEFERFRQATELLEECESCAVAYFMDGYCPKCRISYRGSRAKWQAEHIGLRTPVEKPDAAPAPAPQAASPR